MLGFLKRLFAGDGGARDTARAASWVQEGYVLARTGKLTPALEKYDAACALAPTLGVAFLNRAFCRQDAFNLKARTWSPDEKTATLVQIADDLERAVELLPDELAAWRCLGHVSRRLCRYTRADLAFAALEERAPADYPHKSEIARERRAIAPKVGKERALDAVRALVVERDATEEEIARALTAMAPLVDEARAAFAEAKRAEAKRAELSTSQPATRAPDAKGDDAPVVDDGLLLPIDVLVAVGVLARRAGDLVRAAETLSFVIDVDKENPDAHRELSTIAALAGNAEAALRHAEAAYRADPSNAALVCNVGVAYLALGRLAPAEEFIAIAKDMAPKDPIVLRAWSALSAEKDARGVAGA